MAENKKTNLFIKGKKAALIALLAVAPLTDVRAVCPNDYYLSAGKQNVYNPIKNAIERNTQPDDDNFTSILLKIEGFIFLCFGVAIRKNIIDEREKHQRLKKMQRLRSR